MINKWLKAGVLEDGLLRHATEGSPQGVVVSPCLSNIFLHHDPDEWFQNEAKQESLISVGLADQLDVPFGVGT